MAAIFHMGIMGLHAQFFESSPSWQTAQPEESPANYTEGTFKELMKDVEDCGKKSSITPWWFPRCSFFNHTKGMIG